MICMWVNRRTVCLSNTCVYLDTQMTHIKLNTGSNLWNQFKPLLKSCHLG